MAEATGGVVEVVVFALREGATAEQLLASNDAVEEWAKTQPGFISKEMFHVADQDKWIDIVRWETMDAAHAAADAAVSSESCAAMFGLIDTESTLILHGEPKARAFAGGAA
ncbi:MAG TPA: antibiotic biosynthesis monooxygenase [Thermoleophilaceae bacterium]|nr:antibiotic biosynthesis monooxygenase [Thermoleophilaceae bacterium]